MGKHIMKGSNSRSVNGYTLDTCVGIKIIENQNIANLLKCRIQMNGASIHFCTQSVFEATKLGFQIEQISKIIENKFETDVFFGTVTDEMVQVSYQLERDCPSLHYGDSKILAYAKITNTILVTCDKALALAAKQSNVQVVNPDILPCDKINQNQQSRITKVVQKSIQKPIAVQQKIKSIALKPGQKIIWRSFN